MNMLGCPDASRADPSAAKNSIERVLEMMNSRRDVIDRQSAAQMLELIGAPAMRRLVDQIETDLAIFRARIDADLCREGEEPRRFFHKALGFSTQFFFPSCAALARQALKSDLASAETVRWLANALREEMTRASAELGGVIADIEAAGSPPRRGDEPA